LSDGRPLGHLRAQQVEGEWAEGIFCPTPAFEVVRHLFEREAELARDQIIPLWEEAADAVDALQIQVVEEGTQQSFSRVRFHLEGNELFIGAELPTPAHDSRSSFS
jgi:hypothetical protein